MISRGKKMLKTYQVMMSDLRIISSIMNRMMMMKI